MNIVYEAADGTRFNKKHECEQYERTNAKKMVLEQGDVTLRELFEYIVPNEIEDYYNDNDDDYNEDEYSFSYNNQYGEEPVFVALMQKVLERMTHDNEWQDKLKAARSRKQHDDDMRESRKKKRAVKRKA